MCVCGRERNELLQCEQRCWGTLLSESSCVFNLLTHFQGGHAGSSQSPVPLLDPQQLPPSADPLGQTIPCPSSPAPPTLLPLSPILSSVCLHISALASFPNLLLSFSEEKKGKSTQLLPLRLYFFSRSDVKGQAQPGESYSWYMGRVDVTWGGQSGRPGLSLYTCHVI